jgi:hypothetical protein
VLQHNSKGDIILKRVGARTQLCFTPLWMLKESDDEVEGLDLDEKHGLASTFPQNLKKVSKG